MSVGEPLVENAELGPIDWGESKNRTVTPSMLRSKITSDVACRPLASVISDCEYGSIALNWTETGPLAPVIEKDRSYSAPLPTELAAPKTEPGRLTLAEAEAVCEIESATPLALAHVTLALEFAVVPVSKFDTNSPRLFCAYANDWAVGENTTVPLAGVMVSVSSCSELFAMAVALTAGTAPSAQSRTTKDSIQRGGVESQSHSSQSFVCIIATSKARAMPYFQVGNESTGWLSILLN